jgi:hypothetical protein
MGRVGRGSPPGRRATTPWLPVVAPTDAAHPHPGRRRPLCMWFAPAASTDLHHPPTSRPISRRHGEADAAPPTRNGPAVHRAACGSHLSPWTIRVCVVLASSPPCFHPGPAGGPSVLPGRTRWLRASACPARLDGEPAHPVRQRHRHRTVARIGSRRVPHHPASLAVVTALTQVARSS